MLVPVIMLKADAADAGKHDQSNRYPHHCQQGCLLYTSDAADERSSVDLGGRRIIKKKNNADIGGTVGFADG